MFRALKQTSPLCVRLFRKPGAAHLRRVPRSGAQAYFTCCGRSENTGFAQILRLHPWLLCVALCAAHAAETASPAPARWEIPTNTAAVELVSRAGTNQNKLTVTLADATTRVFSWRAQGSSLTLDLRKNKQAPPDRQTVELPDQSLVLEGPWVGGSRICYARPNLQVYDKTRQLELIEKWTNLPPASTHWMKLVIRPDTHGFETWINGNYAGRFDGPSPVSMALETGTSGAFMTPCFQRADSTADGFIQLDLTRFETSLFKIVSWPWQDGPARIKNIPFLFDGQHIVDLGRVRHVPATAEERDYYLARSPLDNMRESAHFTVPPNLYARAHLLCFLDDSPGKSSEAIARITRYVFLRGISCDAIMDSHFRLPRNNEPIPEFARQVGEITVARDNATNAVPLFLVSLPLHTGAIADLVFQPHASPLLRKEAGLDFELVGPTQKPRYASHAPYPDNTVTSGVQVPAITLEQTPFEIEMTPLQPGNIFHNKEIPQLIEETLDTASCAGEIRLKTPIPVPGEPDTIGVLVKGNSSWARLNFCFLDAEGEVWESSGADWPADLSVNFDGWNWICFPINQEATWHHGIYPNWIKGYWRTISGWTKSIAGNKQIDFPISLLGLSVVQPRTTLKLTEMTDVQESAIGIKAFAAGKNPGDNPPKP